MHPPFRISTPFGDQLGRSHYFLALQKIDVNNPQLASPRQYPERPGFNPPDPHVEGYPLHRRRLCDHRNPTLPATIPPFVGNLPRNCSSPERSSSRQGRLAAPGSSLAINPLVCQIRRRMDLTFGAEYEAFRRDARAWLASHVPPGPLPSPSTAAGLHAHRAWEALMFADGWSAVRWPTEYGGRGLGIMEWLVFEEEYQRARGPERVSEDGLFLLGPSLIDVGSAVQKERFLPAIASGEEIWCHAWADGRSGPTATRSRATRSPETGGWRLSGQTTCAKGGSYAQWCFGFFRTDPDAGPDRGFTTFLISLDSPGVDVRPLRAVEGAPGVAEISFDDVEVSGGQVLGSEGTGWSVAMSMAGNERGFSVRSPAATAEAASRLIHLFELRGAPAMAADAVARAYIDAQAYQLHTYWTASKVARGQPAGPDSGCNTIFRSETDVALYETALVLLGTDAELLEAGSPGEWLDGFLMALAERLDTRANEVQRLVVAQRLLGFGGP